jgi:hypothetical protein
MTASTIRYARACSLYSDFLKRHRLLNTKLLSHQFLSIKYYLTNNEIWHYIVTVIRYAISLAN